MHSEPGVENTRLLIAPLVRLGAPTLEHADPEPGAAAGGHRRAAAPQPSADGADRGRRVPRRHRQGGRATELGRRHHDPIAHPDGRSTAARSNMWQRLRACCARSGRPWWLQGEVGSRSAQPLPRARQPAASKLEPAASKRRRLRLRADGAASLPPPPVHHRPDCLHHQGGSALNTAVQLSALLRTRRQSMQADPTLIPALTFCMARILTLMQATPDTGAAAS